MADEPTLTPITADLATVQKPTQSPPYSTHDHADVGSQPVTVSSQSTRYEIGLEIARGGMGVVHVARDTALNREVAVKVLRPEFAGRTTIARRFVEEAQIAGQLQHPGVPPVYDRGTLPDGRPFMALKLIKGETLSDKLEAGEGGTLRSLADLLVVFEKVCDAVAYAHGHGVIHRDLKPNNIMVGAHGEVQVMDWGLAKVLTSGREETRNASEDGSPPGTVIETSREPDSKTQAGSLLGTPAYMPPEQAKGEVNRVDARADVFALGAVLCELLTGDPPYTGTSEEVRAKAVIGQVGPAFGWLDGCGEDPELVALAKTCLSPDPADRPPDAGAVAAAVVAYRAGVESRLRRAELAAARAEAKATELRKRRRVQLALGVAAAAVIALVGYGAWRQREQAAERDREQVAARDAARRDLDAALNRAAEALPRESIQVADESLRRAGELIEAAAAPDLTNCYDGLRADRDLIAELDRVWARANAMQDGHVPGTESRPGDVWFDGTAARDGYPAAFSNRGLAVMTADPADVGARIATSPVHERMIAALDDWLAFATPADRPRLVELLARADPHPARNEIRKAYDSPDRLKALLTNPHADTLRVAARATFAKELPAELAASVARAAVVRYPEDFRVLYIAAVETLPVNSAAAVGYFQTVLILRPDNFAAVYGLGLALHLSRKPTESGPQFLRAAQLAPGFSSAYVNLADAIKNGADHRPAVAHFEKAVRDAPNDFMSHFGLGMALRERDHGKAAEAFRKSIALNPKFALAHNYLGYVADSPNESIRAWKRAAELDPKFAFAHYNLGNLYRGIGAALVKQGNKAQAIEFLREAERKLRDALAVFPTHTYSLVALGETLILLDRPAEAVATYRRLLEVDPKDGRAYTPLGTTLLRLQKPKEAAAVYRQFTQYYPEEFGGHDGLVLALSESGANAEAVRVYQDAVLKANPKWSAGQRQMLRYNAACAAALAGTGQGADAPPAGDRRTFRSLALGILRADFPTLRPAKPNERLPDFVNPVHWVTDPDFTAVRHPMAVGFLPPDERAAWRQLWADVRRVQSQLVR
jgi:tetratricopeptide (TPR) repeat protein